MLVRPGHGERAVVMAQHADAQQLVPGQPLLFGRLRGGRAALQVVTAVQGERLGAEGKQQAEQQQGSNKVHCRLAPPPAGQMVIESGDSTEERRTMNL